MANATKLPLAAEFKYFHWRGQPHLTVGLDQSASDTTLYWSIAPRDETGAIVTGAFLSSWTNKDGDTEYIWIPASAVEPTAGLSATGCVRGIDPKGLDYTVGDASFILELSGGSKGNCVIAAQSGELLRAAIQGLIATGGSGLILGTDADGTVTLYRSTGTGTNTGFLRWNTSNDKTEYSNDGSSWNAIDNVTASNLLVVTASDTTPGNLNDKTASGNAITRTVLNPGGNETLQFSVNGTLATTISDVTATATEINQVTDGVSANVTATNLNTLTGGSNADALHSHLNPSKSYTAYEAITAGDKVALLPVEVQWYTQLGTTGNNIALGDSNVRRKYYVKYIPTANESFTSMNFRAAEAVSGATATGVLTVSIQTDSAGEPSGTAVTNATATFSQVTQRTWTNTDGTRTATFAGTVSLTSGTTYHVVWECAATDGTNYINIRTNDSFDENYLTFTRGTYNLDTATWGNTVTNATPYFWFSTRVSMALCPTDSNFGGRTWTYVGSAVSNISALASGLVYIGDIPTSGLTSGATYWLSSTPGGVTTTKPNPLFGQDFAYKIGYADSTTTLKRELGEKMVWGNAAPTGSATTSHQFITWFQPTFMEVTGGYLSTANILDTSRGYYDGTNNYATVNRITNGGAPITNINTDASFGGDDSGGAYWKGVAASVTNAGLTYTVTKTSTPLDYNIIWKITGN